MTAAKPAIPRGVWLLGAVSLLTDVSSEIVNALLPLYLVTQLMASAAVVGLIEGFATATAMVTKLFAGVWSDRVSSRKALTVAGYGLAALSKPLVPLATSVTGLALAKFVDRVGKGIRSAPRDALVADIAPPEVRGAAFGARKSLDTVGGFVGPLAAMGLMLWTSNDIIKVFWIATIPAFLAVAVLVVGVHEPPRRTPAKGDTWQWSSVWTLTPVVWRTIALACLFALARFSEAFLLLRAADVGVSTPVIPLVLVVLHAFYGLASYPAGRLSDRYGRFPFIVAGLCVLIAAHALLAIGGGELAFWGGIVLWGIHMGLTQGALTTLVADVCPPALRGSAFGVLSLASGIAMAAGNVAAGAVWALAGPTALFASAAGVALLVLLVIVLRGHSPSPAT